MKINRNFLRKSTAFLMLALLLPFNTLESIAFAADSNSSSSELTTAKTATIKEDDLTTANKSKKKQENNNTEGKKEEPTKAAISSSYIPATTKVTNREVNKEADSIYNQLINKLVLKINGKEVIGDKKVTAKPEDPFSFFYSWALTDDIKQKLDKDNKLYFDLPQFKEDENSQLPPFRLLEKFSIDLVNSDGEVCGTALVDTNGHVTMSFNKNISTLTNISGTFSFEGKLNMENLPVDNEHVIEIPHNDEYQGGPIEVKIPDKKYISKKVEKSENKGKNMVSIPWKVTLNSSFAYLNKFCFEDPLPKGSKLEEGSFKITEIDEKGNKIDLDSALLKIDGQKLIYSLPDKTNKKYVISFRTLSDLRENPMVEDKDKNQQLIVKNIAHLTNHKDKDIEASASADYAANFNFNKTFKESDNKNITWNLAMNVGTNDADREYPRGTIFQEEIGKGQKLVSSKGSEKLEDIQKELQEEFQKTNKNKSLIIEPVVGKENTYNITFPDGISNTTNLPLYTHIEEEKQNQYNNSLVLGSRKSTASAKKDGGIVGIELPNFAKVGSGVNHWQNISNFTLSFGYYPQKLVYEDVMDDWFEDENGTVMDIDNKELFETPYEENGVKQAKLKANIPSKYTRHYLEFAGEAEGDNQKDKTVKEKLQETANRIAKAMGFEQNNNQVVVEDTGNYTQVVNDKKERKTARIYTITFPQGNPVQSGFSVQLATRFINVSMGERAENRLHIQEHPDNEKKAGLTVFPGFHKGGLYLPQENKILWSIGVEPQGSVYGKRAVVYDVIPSDQQFDEESLKSVKVYENGHKHPIAIKRGIASVEDMNPLQGMTQIGNIHYELIKPENIASFVEKYHLKGFPEEKDAPKGILVFTGFPIEKDEVYRLEFKTTPLKEGKIANNAKYTEQNQPYLEANATVDTKNHEGILKKNGKQDGDYMSYSLDINKDKQALKQVVIKDEGWQNLEKDGQIDLKLFKENKEGKLEEIDVNYQDKSTFPNATTGLNQIILRLGDINEHYRVTYKLKAKQIESTVPVVNKAKISWNGQENGEIEETVIKDFNVQTGTGTIEYAKKNPLLRLRKEDKNKQALLSGVEFELRASGELVSEGATMDETHTDADKGRINFGEIKPNTWYILKETKALPGYKIQDYLKEGLEMMFTLKEGKDVSDDNPEYIVHIKDKFGKEEILPDNNMQYKDISFDNTLYHQAPTIRITVPNEKGKQFDLPKTGSNSQGITILVGLSLTIIAILGLTYSDFQKKKVQ